MTTHTLKTMLRPENVLMKSDEMLIPFGGRPFGKEKDLENLIQELTKPIIERADRIKSTELYKKDVTISSPEYQIRGKAKAFARIILDEKSVEISNFSEGHIDREALEDISEVICTIIGVLCADYFVQRYTNEISHSKQKHIELSDL